MTTDRSSEETAVIATYSSRRDAEVAKDYLDDEGIQAFVSTDDAGGMHPQLQRPHGVKLVGMSGTAQEAHDMLDEVGLLPASGEETARSRASRRETQAEDLSFSTDREFSVQMATFIIGFVVAVLALLFFVL